MKCKIALITIAILGIFMAPALSMPWNNNASDERHCGMHFLAKNLTEEEINNMTLGQFHDMRQEARGNSTFHAKEQRQNRTDRSCPVMGESGCIRDNANQRSGPQGYDHRGLETKGSLILLLSDDLNVDKLNNMTINQIKDMKQQKFDELNNMTIGQIKALKEKKIQEQDNLTVKEFRTKNQEMHKLSSILGLGGAGNEMTTGNGRGKGDCGSMTNKNKFEQ